VFEPSPMVPRSVRMTGVSHFMLDRYAQYDAPARVEPPANVRP
jgi:hypothetical protein